LKSIFENYVQQTGLKNQTNTTALTTSTNFYTG